MEILLLLIRLFLFGVFLLAGITKLLDLPGSEKAVKAFGTPEEFAKTFAIALPFAEIVFAVCFLFTGTAWVGAIGALILLLSFIGGMIWQISQGKAPECHCFGQLHSEPVGKKTLIRNIAFALLALILIGQGRNGQGMSLADTDAEMLRTIFLLLIFVVVAVVLFFVKRLSDQQTEIIKRLDVMDVISRDGKPVERQEAGNPLDSLPIGAPFPEFSIKDGRGKIVEFDHILAAAKPTLFLFVSPTCNPCGALMPEVAEWQSEMGHRVNFVIVSSGTLDANKKKFGDEIAERILIEEKRELVETVHAKWTPAAIFVTHDGIIASHTANGDSAIRNLVEKIRTEDLTREFVFFAEKTVTGKPPMIGKSIPEFSLNDLDGRTITKRDIVGKTTLAIFWSTDCPHCVRMMTEIQEWDKSKSPEDPQLIVFSEEDNELHQELGLNSSVLLEKGYKTAIELGMFGTPSAVLIDEEGRIVTETAIGAGNIWALIGKYD
ncbi:MAG: MauE/DoxX family redox-associated membrane protein [Pyrinomonadaceae bacterium]